MGRDTPVYNSKNILEVPLGLSIHRIPFYTNYEESAKCSPTFWWVNFFPSSPNIDKSVSTQRFFPKKGKK